MNGKARPIEEYLSTLASPYKELMERLRTIILTSFPTIKETVMHEGLWFESRFYLAKLGDHVNLGVNIKGLSKEEVFLFLGTGKTMRHLKFYPNQEIDKPKLLEKLQIVYQKADAGEQITWHLDKKNK